jgi:hypothetical protein
VKLKWKEYVGIEIYLNSSQLGGVIFKFLNCVLIQVLKYNIVRARPNWLICARCN